MSAEEMTDIKQRLMDAMELLQFESSNHGYKDYYKIAALEAELDKLYAQTIELDTYKRALELSLRFECQKNLKGNPNKTLDELVEGDTKYWLEKAKAQEKK